MDESEFKNYYGKNVWAIFDDGQGVSKKFGKLIAETKTFITLKTDKEEMLILKARLIRIEVEGELK
jgi:hypothetical protein